MTTTSNTEPITTQPAVCVNCHHAQSPNFPQSCDEFDCDCMPNFCVFSAPEGTEDGGEQFEHDFAEWHSQLEVEAKATADNARLKAGDLEVRVRSEGGGEPLQVCGFCGKTGNEVTDLIQTAVGYICNECTTTCSGIVRGVSRAPERIYLDDRSPQVLLNRTHAEDVEYVRFDLATAAQSATSASEARCWNCNSTMEIYELPDSGGSQQVFCAQRCGVSGPWADNEVEALQLYKRAFTQPSPSDEAREQAQDIVIESSKAAGYADSTWLDGLFKLEPTNRIASALRFTPEPNEQVKQRARALQGEDGVAIIAAERLRQVTAEGWTPEHDDEHEHGELAIAAAWYAIHGTDASIEYPDDNPEGSGWPWGAHECKPKDTIRNLARAGALIAAEIDRVKRRAPSHFTATDEQGERIT